MASWGRSKRNLVLSANGYPVCPVKIRVTGKAKYTFDINRPGMLYGRILRSEIARADVVGIDLSEAEAMPRGSKRFYRSLKLEGKSVTKGKRSPRSQRRRMTSRETQFGVSVLILKNYPMWSQKKTQCGKTHHRSEDDWDGNQSEPNVREEGDVAAGFEQAAVEVEATYHAPVQTHVCLETHGNVAEWEDEEHLTVWASTQGVFGVRNDLAGHFNLPANQVRVITEHMGGGFGSKFGPGVEGRTVANLARATGRPVKLMLTRKAEHLVAGNRPSMTQHVRAGATSDGRLIAYDMKGHGTGGISSGARFSSPLRLSCAQQAH